MLSKRISRICRQQTAYAVYSAKEKAKSSVSDFKRGMVQETAVQTDGTFGKAGKA